MARSRTSCIIFHSILFLVIPDVVCGLRHASGASKTLLNAAASMRPLAAAAAFNFPLFLSRRSSPLGTKEPASATFVDPNPSGATIPQSSSLQPRSPGHADLTDNPFRPARTRSIVPNAWEVHSRIVSQAEEFEQQWRDRRWLEAEWSKKVSDYLENQAKKAISTIQEAREKLSEKQQAYLTKFTTSFLKSLDAIVDPILEQGLQIAEAEAAEGATTSGDHASRQQPATDIEDLDPAVDELATSQATDRWVASVLNQEQQNLAETEAEQALEPLRQAATEPAATEPRPLGEQLVGFAFSQAAANFFATALLSYRNFSIEYASWSRDTRCNAGSRPLPVPPETCFRCGGKNLPFFRQWLGMTLLESAAVSVPRTILTHSLQSEAQGPGVPLMAAVPAATMFVAVLAAPTTMMKAKLVQEFRSCPGRPVLRPADMARFAFQPAPGQWTLETLAAGARSASRASGAFVARVTRNFRFATGGTTAPIVCHPGTSIACPHTMSRVREHRNGQEHYLLEIMIQMNAQQC